MFASDAKGSNVNRTDARTTDKIYIPSALRASSPTLGEDKKAPRQSL